MALNAAATKALEFIKADEMLLGWARYSIMYNTGRKHQAQDFIIKLQNHNIAYDHSETAFAAALKQLEKDDNETNFGAY